MVNWTMLPFLLSAGKLRQPFEVPVTSRNLT